VDEYQKKKKREKNVRKRLREKSRENKINKTGSTVYYQNASLNTNGLLTAG
jgi:hypothetical protein